MGQKLIITETEKNNILSLYEQDKDIYAKENNFLKRYVGKTLNLYTDPSQSTEIYTSEPYKINDIEYDGKMIIINYMGSARYINISCFYNPSKIGNKISLVLMDSKPYQIKTVYNKKFTDELNTLGLQNGISWCKKPQADFASKNNGQQNKSIS